WEHDYLSAVCRRLLGEFTDGDDFSNCTAPVLRPDGRHFAYALRDGPRTRLVVRDAVTLEPLLTIPVGRDVLALAYSADGTCLVAAGPNWVAAWDARTGARATEARQLPQNPQRAITLDGRWL